MAAGATAVSRRVVAPVVADENRSRRDERLLGVALGVLAVGVAYFGLVDLGDMAAAIRRHAPLVTVSTGSAAVLPAAGAMIVLAMMLLLRPSPRNQRRLFGCALGILALVPIAPFALHGWTGAMLPAKGYAGCRPAVATRFLTSIWVRGSVAACPDRD